MANEGPALTLVSHALCPYVQRAAIVLAEKGATFERRTVDLANKPDWFLRISPLGKTPVLLVGNERNQTPGIRIRGDLRVPGRHDRAPPSSGRRARARAASQLDGVWLVDPQHHRGFLRRARRPGAGGAPRGTGVEVRSSGIGVEHRTVLRGRAILGRRRGFPVRCFAISIRSTGCATSACLPAPQRSVHGARLSRRGPRCATR